MSDLTEELRKIREELAPILAALEASTAGLHLNLVHIDELLTQSDPCDGEADESGCYS